MRVDTRTVLTDFLTRITRGEIVSEREQSNVLEVCARVVDETLLGELVKLVGAERAAPEARVKALEIVAAHRPQQAVELATAFLRGVDVKVQREVLKQAPQDWFQGSDELVERVAELATGSTRPEVQMDAQRALVGLPLHRPAPARVLLRAWMHEPDPTLRGMIRAHAAEMAALGRDPVAQAIVVLCRAIAEGEGDEQDWLLLGRVRREGGGAPSSGLSMLSRVWLSARAHRPGMSESRPSLFRSAASALLSLGLVCVLLALFGLGSVQGDELIGFGVVASALAALSGALAARFAVPASMVPERGSLVPVEMGFAALMSVPFAGLALWVIDDAINAGYASVEQLGLLFLIVLAAFAVTRLTSLAAYGLADTATMRRRLQIVFATVSGLAVLMLTCALDPVWDSAHEMLLLLFSAPALLTVSMIYAALDNAVPDLDARDGGVWRKVVIAPALAVVVLLPLLSILLIGGQQSSSPTGVAFSVDRTESAPSEPLPVPFGVEFEVQSSYRQTVLLTATHNVDIALSVRPKGATADEQTEPLRVDDSVEFSEELRYAFSPGIFLVCVDRYTTDCNRGERASQGVRLDEFADSLDARLRLRVLHTASTLSASGRATLTLGEGIPEVEWRRLQGLEAWLSEIGQRPPAAPEAAASTGYFVALRDLEVQGMVEAEAVEGTRSPVVQGPAPAPGVAGDAGPTVRIARGSLLFRADAKQPFTVVLGNTRPRVSSIRPRRVPETLRALATDERPDGAQLDFIATAMELTERTGSSRVESSALLAVLRSGDREAAALYESLAFRAGAVTPYGSLPTYVAVLDTFRSVGAGIFRVRSRNRQGALQAALVYGWHLFETQTRCFTLESGYVVLDGDTVEPAWSKLLDILYARSGELHLDELRIGLYPESAADCGTTTPWTNNVERLTALQGRFLRQFDIDLMRLEEPAQFRHYYVVTEERGGHYNYLPRGTIIRGLEWFDLGEPNFDVVYGYSLCGDTCFVDFAATAHLGSDYRPSYDALPEEFRQKWTADERRRYEAAELVDNRPLAAAR